MLKVRFMKSVFIMLVLAVFMIQLLPALAEDWIMFDQNYYNGENGQLIDSNGVFVDLDSVVTDSSGRYEVVLKAGKDYFDERINCTDRTVDWFDYWALDWVRLQYPNENLINIVCTRQKIK